MENNLENLTIGVFAKAAGVNVETIRFYQRKGLLPEPDKPYGSIRRYGAADVTRVRFVKSAQRLGFSLDEIAELLRLDDGTHCEEASSLAEHKLQDVREKMADLAEIPVEDTLFDASRLIVEAIERLDPERKNPMVAPWLKQALTWAVGGLGFSAEDAAATLGED